MQDTGGGSDTNSNIKRNVGELRKLFDEKVNFTNTSIRKKAARLAKGSSGERTIDQFCKIYDYMKMGDGGLIGEWSYLSDPREGDLYQSASETLNYGEEGDPKCVGVGDCDDLAILMAALVESIGGTTRIILAHNNITGGHAYTEIYLGNSSERGNQVEQIIRWVKQKYNTDKIYTHIDTDTRDVWLNLDWGPENRSGIQSYHPGGPFYQGDRHIVVLIREDARKTYLNVPENFNKIKLDEKSTIPENMPPTLTSLMANIYSPQEAGTTVTWTAEAKDSEDDQISYLFFLNGRPATGWQSKGVWSWVTNETDVGDNQIEVRIRDGEHADTDSYDGHKEVSFTITAPKPEPPENQPPVTKRTAAEDEDLRRTIEEREDNTNPEVHEKAVLLAAKYPGDYTIDQICSIYSYLKDGDSTTRGWSYIGDPRGQDYFRYANETLNLAKEVGSSGSGGL